MLPHLTLTVLSFVALGGGCGETATDRGREVPPTTPGDATVADAGSGFVGGDGGHPADASGDPPDAGARDAGDGPAPPPETDPDVTCGNLRPDEPSGELDCADEETCGDTPVCCVDSERRGCCSAPVDVMPMLDLASCFAAGESCLDAFERFGSPSPAAQPLGDGQALWLGGSAAIEGGLVGRTLLDPSGTLEARADIAVLSGCEERGVCAETVALGFTTATTPSDATARALAAVISLDTRQLLLVDGQEVVAHQSLSGATGAPELVLRLTAAGTLRAELGGDALEAPLRSVPRSMVRAVVFGRSANASASHVFVRSLQVLASACDRPRAAVLDDAPIELRQEGSDAAATLEIDRMAVFDAESGRRAIIGDRGVLRAAREGADRSWDIDFTPGGVLGGGFDRSVQLAGVLADAVTDRWLLVVVLDRVDVVAYPGDGTRFDLAAPRVITSAGVLGLDGIDAPAIGRDAEGLVLAFAVSDERGRGVVRTASGTEGAMSLDADAIAPSELPGAFDGDGVGRPALWTSRGLLHLLYVGRRGVTESVGLVRRTSRRTSWLRYLPGPVVAPGGAPWRALGVGAPAPVLRPLGGGVASLDVYFLGSDGLYPSVGVARRTLPDSTW